MKAEDVQRRVWFFSLWLSLVHHYLLGTPFTKVNSLTVITLPPLPPLHPHLQPINTTHTHNTMKQHSNTHTYIYIIYVLITSYKMMMKSKMVKIIHLQIHIFSLHPSSFLHQFFISILTSLSLTVANYIITCIVYYIYIHFLYNNSNNESINRFLNFNSITNQWETFSFSPANNFTQTSKITLSVGFTWFSKVTHLIIIIIILLLLEW